MPRPGGERAGGWPGGLPLVLAAAVALHLPTLGGYFLGDDFAFVRLYQTLPARVFGGLFFADWSQGIWGQPGRELRPLLAASYWLDFRLWGAHALGFRLTNLAWLVLSLWGMHRLVRARERSEASHAAAAASVATAVFAAHPALPGAVDWIAGRSDLLAAAAVFWSLHFLARHLETGRAAPAVLGALAFAAGLFAKENVVAVALLLPALLAVDAARGRVAARRWAAVLGPVGLVCVAWIAIRYSAFGPVGGPVGALRSGEARWGYYAGQLLQLPRAAAVTVAVAALAATVALAWRCGRERGASWLFWGVAWPLATLAPAAAATYESPRHVLLAVAGPAVVLAKLATLAWDRASRARLLLPALAVALVVAALGAQSFRIVALHAAMGRASRELRQLLAAAPPACRRTDRDRLDAAQRGRRVLGPRAALRGRTALRGQARRRALRARPLLLSRMGRSEPAGLCPAGRDRPAPGLPHRVGRSAAPVRGRHHRQPVRAGHASALDVRRGRRPDRAPGGRAARPGQLKRHPGCRPLQKLLEMTGRYPYDPEVASRFRGCTCVGF